MGQENYGYCIKYSFQTNLNESIHTIQKMIKAAEKVEFEDGRHIVFIMELVQQVDDAREPIKKKKV